MASRAALKRLTLEHKALIDSPTPYIEAHPTDDNILQWYYLITGPPDTLYEGGQFMGSLTFPPEYPYKPPAIRMLTPTGRFDPGSRICLTMSDFHPDTWNPAWNVSTILTGLLSFMCGEDVAAGAMVPVPTNVKNFTKHSVKWNLKNNLFRTHFPDVVKQIEESAGDAEVIEVIPPKASDLVKQIQSTYRPAAYGTAALNAKEKVKRGECAKDAAAGSGKDHSVLVWGVLGLAFAIVVWLCAKSYV